MWPLLYSYWSIDIKTQAWLEGHVYPLEVRGGLYTALAYIGDKSQLGDTIVSTSRINPESGWFPLTNLPKPKENKLIVAITKLKKSLKRRKGKSKKH